jgi:CBS domain-containing protein
MKTLAVESIVTPMEEGMPLKPSVGPGDRITDAVEVMLKNDLKRIAVTEEDRPVGMITLKDALEELGLKEDRRSRQTRSVVFQGRKFIIDG